jgi:hypothetical protein
VEGFPKTSINPVDVRKQVADAPVFSGLNDVALAFFEKPLRFRGLLVQAEDDEIGSKLDDADLASAAHTIRELYAYARHIPATSRR